MLRLERPSKVQQIQILAHEYKVGGCATPACSAVCWPLKLTRRCWWYDKRHAAMMLSMGAPRHVACTSLWHTRLLFAYLIVLFACLLRT